MLRKKWTEEDAKAKERDFFQKLCNLHPDASKVIVMWECQWKELKKCDAFVKRFMETKYLSKPSRRLIPRNVCRSGRFECFKHTWSHNEKTDFRCLDISSLYPTVAMNNTFPIGKFDILVDQKVLQKIRYDEEKKKHFLDNVEMVGIAHVKIVAPKTIKEPFLGSNYKGKYIYSLCNACIKKPKVNCKHAKKNRAITAELCWPEINYAKELGYEIISIFEAYQYYASADLFSKFVKLLARNKIIHSKAPKEEIDKYCSQINQSMKFSGNLIVNPEDIKPNIVTRKYFKDALVSFLGKFGQQNRRTRSIIIQSQGHLSKTFYTSKIEQMFPFEKAVLVVIRESKKISRFNHNANSIIYSHILSLARIEMHRHLMHLWNINLTVYSINNDAIYFTLPRDSALPFNLSQSFGHFKDEFQDCTIIKYVSFGPKTSCIYYIDENNKVSYDIKARGFSLKAQYAKNIVDKIDFEKFLFSSLTGDKKSIKIPQYRHKHNFQQLNTTEVMLIYEFDNILRTNRIVFTDGSTLPFGSQK